MERVVKHTIETVPAACARCGKTYGYLEDECVVLCREGCLAQEVAHVDPTADDRDQVRFEKGEIGCASHPARARQADGDPHEHRKVICGQCMRPVGAIQMRDRGPTPAVFHAGPCFEAYLEAGESDPRGSKRGR